MPLKNACFVSYRHGQYELMKEFVTDFCAALCCELEPMLQSGGVFLDHERLRGGDFYNQTLAGNLYESATMVMVYTPTYFDAEYTYCAREYSAMVSLERERLSRLRGIGSGDHGLILPVILRGSRNLPEEIKGGRQYYNFENFQLGGRRLSYHPRFAPVIREIAAYISERYAELLRLPEDTFQSRDRFRLPSETEIAPFLNAISRFRMPFPRAEVSWAPQALSAGL